LTGCLVPLLNAINPIHCGSKDSSCLFPRTSAKEVRYNRKYITNQIRNVCEKTLGKTRAKLGIVAADRAQLYFRGQWYDIGLDELDQLMHLGTDMLIIEKERVAEVLSTFADKMGIAVLNTRGFLTEYASMLSNLSKKNGCNVAILTDFDVSGLLLARKVSEVYRIGIDFNTLNYFGLQPKDVEEEYRAENNHMKPLKEMGPAEGEDESTFYKNLEYITSKRIEIDSILAKIGNEPFWKYLIQSLVNRFPKRNYNRSIDVPKFVMPDVISEFLDKIKNKNVSTIRSEYELIKDELLDLEGTLDDVNEEEEKITIRFKTAIEKDEKLLPILTKVQKLSDEIEI
jgi:5S rRNA maturation endonuclease (ribonuclease M5)